MEKPRWLACTAPRCGFQASASDSRLLDVGDVVPWVAVQRLLQSQLVEVVADEAHGAAQHEESIQAAKGHEVVALLPGEGSARADHVHEGHRDAAVHVEDQIRALAGGDLLHRQCVVQNWSLLEVLLGIILDDLHALIRVGQGLDAVANAHDELVALLHLLNPGSWVRTAVLGGREHQRGVVQSSAKARADGQEATAEGANQVLAGARRDNGVVGAAHRWAVVCCDLQDHLDELGAFPGQLTPEPEQGEDTSDAQVLLEDLADGEAAILELLASVVGDGGDEVGRLPDHAQLLGPGVVHWHLRSLALRCLHDVAVLH
mmetsp:Transcript_83483/g.150615  ORF Transcript_83483/g.150615 Transcript_83483/m.150615 type:complete len:317 (+) Transcript_83483:664-1614(+)